MILLLNTKEKRIIAYKNRYMSGISLVLISLEQLPAPAFRLAVGFEGPGSESSNALLEIKKSLQANIEHAITFNHYGQGKSVMAALNIIRQ